MYLAKVMTVVTEATKAYFAEPERSLEWRDIHIGVDYPAEVHQYPGIWVDWEPRDHLMASSISMQEYDAELRPMERWRFAGEVTFTVYAMTSLERARLHDQVISMLAEARLKGQSSTFREYLEGNDLVAININLDQIAARAMITTTSTPWGTDDQIYEVTLAISLVGEYLTDPADPMAGIVSRVDLYPYSDTEADPFAEDTEGWA